MTPALERGYYGHAEAVVELEAALAAYLGAEAWQVVCVSSGTAALHLALDALGVGAGDEVIVPSLTFVASFQAVSATGATPRACDVDADTLLMDIDDVARLITPRTRALMPVHYGGRPVDLERLGALAAAHHLRIVEDAAHAFGSRADGRLIGGAGDMTCFSFDSIKTITCGEGGAIVARSETVAARCRQKRLLGIDRENAHVGGLHRAQFYDVSTQGWRYHMSNLNARIGLEQLRKVEGFIARRREICRRYRDGVAGVPGLGVFDVDYDAVAPFLFVVRVPADRRDALIESLREDGVETAINYVPNHWHSLYRSSGACPVVDRVIREIVSLPLHCSLSEEDVSHVIRAVRHFCLPAN